MPVPGDRDRAKWSTHGLLVPPAGEAVVPLSLSVNDGNQAPSQSLRPGSDSDFELNH